MHFMQNRTVTQRKGNLHFFLRIIVLRLTAKGLLSLFPDFYPFILYSIGRRLCAQFQLFQILNSQGRVSLRRAS